MDLQEYVRQRKDVYNLLLEFIEDESEEGNFRKFFENIQNTFSIFNEEENTDELKSLLHLIVKIANNHHRIISFDKKIEQILTYFSSNIRQIFSNIEIYRFFKSNKRILLFLFQNEIITINDEIIDLIVNDTRQRHFFYPEIRSHLSENDIIYLKFS